MTASWIARSPRPCHPRSSYELTDLGHELLVPVNALASWTYENTQRIMDARDAYDQQYGTDEAMAG